MNTWRRTYARWATAITTRTTKVILSGSRTGQYTNLDKYTQPVAMLSAVEAMT